MFAFFRLPTLAHQVVYFSTKSLAGVGLEDIMYSTEASVVILPINCRINIQSSFIYQFGVYSRHYALPSEDGPDPLHCRDIPHELSLSMHWLLGTKLWINARYDELI